MTTQYTSILKLALPVQGELSGTWGDVVNDNITSMVEEAVAGRAVINTWATNSHVLTTADGTTSESRCAMLEFTDTGAALTGAATVVCPNASKLYVCKNDSGQQVTIQTAAGTGVAIPDGQTMFVFCDGTNVEQCETNFNSLSFNGYTLNFGGAVTTAGAFTTSGAYALTLTTTGATNVTLPTTGTLATLDGTETLTNKTLTAPTISSPTLTGSISATDLTISGNTTIGDASSDTLVVNSTITSNLIFTDDTYDIGATGATRPRNLYLSGNATIGGTVTLSGGIDVTGALGVDGDFDVNTDKFTVASATGNTLVAGTLGVTGITTATGGLNVDTISEITASGGVTVDGVLLKDGGFTATTTGTVPTLYGGSGASQTFTLQSTSGNSNHSKILVGNTVGADNGGISFYSAGSTVATERMRISGTNGDITFYDTNGLASFVYDESAGSTFNEQGDNKDFRVESDGQAHMLFVDASTNRVGINNNVPQAFLHVTSGDATPLGSFRVEQTNVSAGGNSWQSLFEDDSSADQGSGNSIIYINSNRPNTSAGKVLRVVGNSKSSEYFSIYDTGEVVVNESSLSTADFRVESDNATHMLFVDASTNRVGIRSTAPASILHVDATAAGEAIISLGDDTGTTGGPHGFDFYHDSADSAKSSMYFRTANNTLELESNSGERTTVFYLETGATTFNETGRNDADFRVESDTNTHALFVDAGTDRVGINTSDVSVSNWSATPEGVIKVMGSKPVYYIEETSTGFTSNPTILLGLNGGNGYLTHNASDSGVAFGMRYVTETTSNLFLSAFNSFVAINEDSQDLDFRVESNNNNAALFVDAGNDRVGILNSSPDFALDVGPTNALGNDGIQINATRNATLRFLGNDTSMQADEVTGRIEWYTSDTNNPGVHAQILTRATNTIASGEMQIWSGTAGSINQNVHFRGDQTVFNEDSNDMDFRVESDNNSTMLQVDAGNDAVLVGSGTINPNTSLGIFGGQVTGYKQYAVGTSDTRIQEGTGGMAIMRNDTNGGVAFVVWEFQATPIIVSQVGSGFTTGTPTGTQIQLLAGSTPSPYGMKAKVASGSQNLRILGLTCDPD